MCGYCETGSARIATSPAITMTIEMTDAKTGRSMKNFEITARPFFAADAALVASTAGGYIGTGLTGAPGRTLITPSTMTRSPP